MCFNASVKYKLQANTQSPAWSFSPPACRQSSPPNAVWSGNGKVGKVDDRRIDEKKQQIYGQFHQKDHVLLPQIPRIHGQAPYCKKNGESFEVCSLFFKTPLLILFFNLCFKNGTPVPTSLCPSSIVNGFTQGVAVWWRCQRVFRGDWWQHQCQTIRYDNAQGRDWPTRSLTADL